MTVPASPAAAPAAQRAPVLPVGSSVLGSPGFLQEEGARAGLVVFWDLLGSHPLPLLFLTPGDEDGAAPVTPVAAPVGGLVPELDLKGTVPSQGTGHCRGVTGSGWGDTPFSPAFGHFRMLRGVGGHRAEPPIRTWEHPQEMLIPTG